MGIAWRRSASLTQLLAQYQAFWCQTNRDRNEFKTRSETASIGGGVPNFEAADVYFCNVRTVAICDWSRESVPFAILE